MKVALSFGRFFSSGLGLVARVQTTIAKNRGCTDVLFWLLYVGFSKFEFVNSGL